MLNSPILDVAISMVFIFFLFSVLTTGITELVITMLGMRGKDLRWAIEEIFNDTNNKNWSELMYDHPLIDGLKKTDDSLPSYISAEVFSMALVDVFIEESKEIKVISTGDNIVYNEIYPSTEYEKKKRENPDTSDFTLSNEERSLYNFKEGVRRINPSDVQQMLKSFIYRSKSYEELIKNIQLWYIEYMDRVTGWFKKRLRYYLFASGLLIAVVANVDSLHLVSFIYKNKDVRDAIVMQAEQYVKENRNEAYIRQVADSLLEEKKKIDAALKPSDSAAAQQSATQLYLQSQLNYVNNVYDTISGMNLPIGWSSYNELYTRKILKQAPVTKTLTNWCNFKSWWKQTWMTLKYNIKSIKFMQVLGWLVTAFALSMGATFWFDLLNKLINMRNSGKKPEPMPSTQSNT